MPSRKTKASAYRKRFGENVAALRQRRKLTQERLAERVDVSPRYIQSIEAGDYFPSLPTLVRLRAALKCDWGDLFVGCDKV
jgi:HTH-type transcriptional regulator, cell division transcriptional repressor